MNNKTNVRNTSYSDYSAKPALGIGDWIQLMLKEIWLMLAVFSVIALLGFSYAMTMQKKYTAVARLSVLVGDEYVYMSRAGAGAGEGQTPKQEQILQSEIEVLTSAQVAARVVKAIGLDNLFEPKDIVVSSGPDTPENRFNVGVEALRKEFGAGTTPNTTVIQLSMNSKNPEMAAKSLNQFIDEYLTYRREVLFENRTDEYGQQRNEFSKELDEINNQLQAFLKQNNVSDFEAENKAIQDLMASTRAELMRTSTSLVEAEGRYGTTSKYYSSEPSEIRLSFETDNSKRRIELQQQLSELLTKYTENSQPVIDMRRRIAAIDSVINSDEGKKSGTIRTGPNPVRDTLATDKARGNAEVVAMNERKIALAAQLAQLETRASALSASRPQYEDLLRKKTVLEEQVKQFSNREATARAQSQMAQTSNDNIRVIERPIVPTKGKSMKKIIMLGSLVFAVFTALVAGLLRALTRNHLPTPRSVGRSLGLPVLATVSK